MVGTARVFAMSSKKKRLAAAGALRKVVPSLLDAMVDGREYASLCDVAPDPKMNFRHEIERAIADIEASRNRKLLCYAGNVVKAVDAPASINRADDLPFSEMVALVPEEANSIDLLVVTPGGMGQQVSQFVNRLRPRFADVAFIVPQMSMSAGTIWALSGDEIWMDERGCLGPIDPQVPGRDGNLLPAQAIVTLLGDLQRMADDRLKNGQAPPWIASEIIANLDPKEIGNASAQSAYAIQLAAEYLERYKFSRWTTHTSSGSPVSPNEKRQRAVEIARKLCSHDYWKVHSHGISRDILWTELKLKIEHLETVPQFHRGVRRLWALLYWIFENSAVAKLFISSNYALFRTHAGDAK